MATNRPPLGRPGRVAVLVAGLLTLGGCGSGSGEVMLVDGDPQIFVHQRKLDVVLDMTMGGELRYQPDNRCLHLLTDAAPPNQQRSVV